MQDGSTGQPSLCTFVWQGYRWSWAPDPDPWLASGNCPTNPVWRKGTNWDSVPEKGVVGVAPPITIEVDGLELIALPQIEGGMCTVMTRAIGREPGLLVMGPVRVMDEL